MSSPSAANSAENADLGAGSGSDSDDRPFTRHASLGYQINHLARMMTMALHEAIEPYGVVPGQFAQLLSLYENDGQTVTELAQDVAIQHPTMSRTLARMERDGLVLRRDDPDDARARRVYLTERAKELEPHLVEAAQAINQRFCDSLSPATRDDLISTIGSVIDAASSVEPTPLGE